jgi:hypothetical protein
MHRRIEHGRSQLPFRLHRSLVALYAETEWRVSIRQLRRLQLWTLHLLDKRPKYGWLALEPYFLIPNSPNNEKSAIKKSVTPQMDFLIFDSEVSALKPLSRSSFWYAQDLLSQSQQKLTFLDGQIDSQN